MNGNHTFGFDIGARADSQEYHTHKGSEIKECRHCMMILK